jgi:hypothetical protein
MGDFGEVERLQAGIRTWLLRTARSGRHELRGISAPAVLPMLCAAAFGPALADASGPARYDSGTPGLLAGACAIADRSLTRQQWASYAGTQPFQRVCPAS